MVFFDNSIPGSHLRIFKNLILNELPEAVRAQVPAGVVQNGKVPAAWFLDQAGGRGLQSSGGGIHVRKS